MRGVSEGYGVCDRVNRDEGETNAVSRDKGQKVWVREVVAKERFSK